MDPDDIKAAVVKVGWKFVGSGGMSMGAWKTTTTKVEKGKLKAEISVVRPSGKGDEPGSMKMSSPKDQEAAFKAKGATFLDADAGVLLAVEIEGDKGEAQKLLDAILKK